MKDKERVRGRGRLSEAEQEKHTKEIKHKEKPGDTEGLIPGHPGKMINPLYFAKPLSIYF